MLVLTRQLGETILIGDDIEIMIVDIRDGKVRIGVNAPKTLAVHRKEVYDQVRRDRRAQFPAPTSDSSAPAAQL